MVKHNDISIKIDPVDVNLMMNDCKDLFLEAHPEFEGVNITKKFMFKKLVRFYLEN